MNRKMTPVLLAVALAIGLIAYLAEKPSSSNPQSAATQGSRVLDVEQADILEVRMKRDYWNSYALKRGPDGSWQLAEPSTEPASIPAVNRLLGVLEVLPVIATIDLPADDSERHREYGLWEPAMEMTVTTGAGSHTLLFGSQTPDGKGTYCAEAGRDKVYVVTAEAVAILSTEYASYRQSPEIPSAQPSSGLRVEELSTGSGSAAQPGQTVSVHYVGRLENGTVFDSSQSHGKPFKFTIGTGQVIPGWEQGVVGMRVGGKRRLLVPPGLAYGDKGRPPKIPPNATLVFDIELLSIGAS